MRRRLCALLHGNSRSTLVRKAFQYIRLDKIRQVRRQKVAVIPTLVLDTNAVLDWLVFDNPASQPIARAIVSGDVRWIVNAAVRDELTHVLARGVVDRWQPDLPRLWHHWERLATPIEQPPQCSPQRRPQCTDADDQKFVDLALDTAAMWLITRDRALLKLARRVRSQGLAIVTPERFTLAEAAAAPA